MKCLLLIFLFFAALASASDYNLRGHPGSFEPTWCVGGCPPGFVCKNICRSLKCRSKCEPA